VDLAFGHAGCKQLVGDRARDRDNPIVGSILEPAAESAFGAIHAARYDRPPARQRGGGTAIEIRAASTVRVHDTRIAPSEKLCEPDDQRGVGFAEHPKAERRQALFAAGLEDATAGIGNQHTVVATCQQPCVQVERLSRSTE